MTGRILVADDDSSLRRVTALQLRNWGYDVCEAADGQAALAMSRESAFDLFLCDLVMDGFTGLELLHLLRAESPGTTVVIFAAFATVENAVTAMRAGAWDFLTKPVHPEHLHATVDKALEHVRRRREVTALRAPIDRKHGFEQIAGQSRALLDVLEVAIRIAAANVTVLIEGETGTGKELVARALHANSSRNGGPFLTVNCAAIPRDLLESELFGHAKGAFTGAFTNKVGKAEMADGGTLFLDEIGELPLEMQAKILRLVQQGEVEKVGGGPPRRVDVRIIAATNRDLRSMSETGAFREDLYYRLAVLPLQLPPLRQRPEDIPILAEHLFSKLKIKHGRHDLALPASVSRLLTNGYKWPGNVRELENVLERAVLLARGGFVQASDLPDHLQAHPTTVNGVQVSFPPQGISLGAVEKELIRQALEYSGDNQSQAARLLGVTRKTLIWRMGKYGLIQGFSQGVRTAAIATTGQAGFSKISGNTSNP